MIFIIPITLFFYFFHEEVVEIMTNNDYANYSKIIVYIVLALSLQKIGDFMAVKGFNLNKPSVYILPRLFQSLTLIIMALFLINNHGVYGIVYSLIASSVIYIMLMAVVNNKLNKEYYS
jgi:O-antigen/teichoic acid export membrane protein